MDDEAYMLEIFLENKHYMYRLAMKYAQEYYIASDIVSMACVKMLENIDILRKLEEKKQTKYVLAIVKNISVNYWRRRRVEYRWLMEETARYSEEQIEDKSPDDILIQEAENQKLEQLIEKLRPGEKEILRMKYFGQMSDEEIGKQLAIATDSVRSYLTRARRALKKELEKEDESNE